MEKATSLLETLFREMRDLLEEIKVEIHRQGEADRAWRSRQLERERWMLEEALVELVRSAGSG